MLTRWVTSRGLLSLDALLLLLSVSGYLLLTRDPFSHFILSVLTPMSIAYLALDATWHIGRQEVLGQWIFRFKLSLIFLALMLSLLIPVTQSVTCRLQEGMHLCAHDGLVQTEEAVRMVMQGVNPYSENYFGTPLEQIPFRGHTNPALYHLAYLPATLVVHILPAALGWHWLGWYDGRYLHVLLLLLSALLVGALAETRERKLALTIALGLNVPLLMFTAEGRNDILVLFWILISVYLAYRNQRSLSLVAMAVGCATKQTAWFALPFYFAYLHRGDEITWRGLLGLVGRWWPFYLTLVLFVGPFLAWDSGAFIDDTVLYLMGRSEVNYPIWGIGLGTLLHHTGLLANDSMYVPFWIPQLVVGMPILVLLLIRQIRSNTLGNFWFGFASLQLVVGYLARIFHGNYFGTIIIAFVFAFLLGSGGNGAEGGLL
jgi:hypothetical protein